MGLTDRSKIRVNWDAHPSETTIYMSQRRTINTYSPNSTNIDNLISDYYSR